ncbi:AaceriAFR518Cp [[Ashbya] aceris (nom. inval.)]|nr:AaceriAFR518Cp [[Ashbya] aceris (nom. inval.)]
MGIIKVNRKLRALVDDTSSPTGSVSDCENATNEPLYGTKGLEAAFGVSDTSKATPHVERAELQLSKGDLPAGFESISDVKYLDKDAFSYTSSFQARPYSDCFDFTQPNSEAIFDAGNQGAVPSLTTDGIISEHDVTGRAELEGISSFVGRESGEQGMDSELEDSSNHIQNVIDQIVHFKSEFRDLIAKIDAASLESARYRYSQESHLDIEQLAEFTGSNAVMSEVVDTVIQTLNGLLPKKTPPKRTAILASSVPPETKKPKVDMQALNARGNSLVSQYPNGGERTVIVQDDDPCSKLPNFGVILIKSPSLISQLWDEYTKLPSEWPVKDLFSFSLQQREHSNLDIEIASKRKMTIRELENSYGSSWRNADKNFSRQINRRKKIWCAIEQGLLDGLELKECFEILENYVRDRGKGLSWYYNGVPFRLIEMSRKHRPSS